MSEPIQVRVPTDSLRKILQENPPVMLKLESMACEKIAEEIMRKATASDLKKLTEDTVRNATDGVTRAMKDSSKWPEPLKKAVMDTVLSALKEQRVNMIKEFQAELMRLEAERVEAWDKQLRVAVNSHYAGFQAEVDQYRATIKQEARAAFFEVLQEARSA